MIVRDLTAVRKNEEERLVTHMLDDINNSILLLEGHSNILPRKLGVASETSLKMKTYAREFTGHCSSRTRTH